MDTLCSAKTPTGCKHGHAINGACLGIGTNLIVPVCCREDRVYDNTNNTMTNRPWNGDPVQYTLVLM